jgi:hypothetical protein
MLQKFNIIFNKLNIIVFYLLISFLFTSKVLSNDIFKYEDSLVYYNNAIKSNIKQDAIIFFQKQALKLIISKITTMQYESKVNEITENLDTNKYITTYSINNEDIAKNRYSASIALSFSEKEIVNLLTTNKIPFILNPTNISYLIIPIWIEKQKKTENVQWDNFWINNTETSFLSNFIYYNYNNFIGKQNDIFIKNLQSNLNVADIYTAEIFLDTENENYNLTLTNIISKQKIDFFGVKSISQAKYLTTSYIEDNQKTLAILKQNNNSYINITLQINYSMLSNLFEIENIFKNDKSIVDLNLKEVGYKYASINFKYKDNLNNLAFLLQSKCFFLDTDTLIVRLIKDCN